GLVAVEPAEQRIVARGRVVDVDAFGDHQARAAGGAAGVIVRGLLARHAALADLQPHGRKHHAVGQGELAELEGGEESAEVATGRQTEDSSRKAPPGGGSGLPSLAQPINWSIA